jgi:hypothetical protein
VAQRVGVDVLPALRHFAGARRAHLAMDLRPDLRLPQLRAVVRRHCAAEVAAEPVEVRPPSPP